MAVAGQTSQQGRKSPSGPLSDVQLPIYGSNLLTTASTHYLDVGSFGDNATENVGQLYIPEAGILRRLLVKNVVPGGTAVFAITYNVRKNGVLIAGATLVTDNEEADEQLLQINEPVSNGDLISVQVVVAAFGGGTSPTVRTTLLWAPGASF